jgi:CDGSH-type Zn-finger protein
MAITTVEELQRHLQWAIELEHATLPPYLCALYSIEEGANEEAAEVIHSVFMEEMLHLTLAANILNAVGGEPQLDTPSILPSFPAYLPHSNKAFQVSLQKFSPEAIQTFLLIERPAEHSGLPEDNNFETIGQFYEAIEDALVRLSTELGEDVLFSGDPDRQVTDALYYGGSGRILAVTDLASAKAALEEIVEQGEGLQHQEIWDGDRDMFHPEREEVAHYFRFQEIEHGRHFATGDTPQSGPTGDPFTVDWEAVYPMRPNPRTADYPAGSEAREKMEAFNHAYCGVLHLLEETFNGSPSLLAVATGLMYGLKAEAIELMQVHSGDGQTTVGPSFEYIPPAERHLARSGEKRIVVIPNGPYLVYGDVPLVRKKKIVSETNDSLTWQKTAVIETEETYALCRCGRSSSKPFCDGTHVRAGFDGTETADPRPFEEMQRVHEGTGLDVRRVGSLCMHAAFCVGRERRIPAMMADTPDSDMRAHIIGLIEHCPSGSYTYAMEPGGEEIEPDLPLAISVTEEEGELAGCLWVTGGIPVVRADRVPWEMRNRVTLCRCGQSSNKPLCDGTHRTVKFREVPGVSESYERLPTPEVSTR